jgi:exosortase B
MKDRGGRSGGAVLRHLPAQTDPASLAAVLMAWALLFVPTYWSLAHNLWWREEQSYGPIILFAAAWLLWQDRHEIASQADGRRPRAGFAWLALGLLLYALGRSQDIVMFEVGAQIPALLGILIVFMGWRAARVAWVPIVLLLFMIPLPGDLVAAVTGPLKSAVSTVATSVLHALGYPIARTGVILTVGQYQLLVADACSGLTSMFTLEALGLVYLKLMGYTSGLRRALIVLLLVPISFVANVIRVCILVLITYHLGDEAGQGFMHGFAGLVLFAVAMVLMLAVDRLLDLFLSRAEKKGASSALCHP